MHFGIMSCPSEYVCQFVRPSMVHGLLEVIHPDHTDFRCKDECIESSNDISNGKGGRGVDFEHNGDGSSVSRGF